ncbi:MAG TPA: His/Gly/Thr/Pro-type tRNA ligase C-terminal domain-containing protein, partial [Ilumatobacteraceae bacterium]|nr:His/Gly/Thr/Pro-type tRNA ligase C-terminal domain-containing protein [Ilumatobacteraceae bacterium]
FFGVLVEHYAGAFPTWMAPVQARVLPVAAAHQGYADLVVERLQREGFRVEATDASDQLGKRIRTAKMDKLPYVLVVGDDDVANNSLGVNPRGGEVERDVGLDEFVARLHAEISTQLANV